MRGNETGDNRSAFVFTLLNKICERTVKVFGKCTIDKSIVVESRNRAKRLLTQGVLHVAAEATRKSWEKDLLFVPIPILKGLLGFKIFFRS